MSSNRTSHRRQEETDVLQVRVMDWITDSPTEQQAHIERTKSFSRIRHLEIRLTGWTLNQNKRVHVGVNTVPLILDTMTQHSLLVEELTIDLECLSGSSHNNNNGKEALLTFGNVITTRNTCVYGCCTSLQKLTIISSGEEDISNHALRYLGRSLRNLASATTLRLSGMNPDHLAIVLGSMRDETSCLEECFQVACPCCLTSTVIMEEGQEDDNHTTSGGPCPRILPPCCCDPYEALPLLDNHEKTALTSDEERFPQTLELHRIALAHKAIASLHSLLLEDSQSSITKLVLRDCVSSTEDLGFLVFLCKGFSVLQELTLERHRIRGPAAWWDSCQPLSPCCSTDTTFPPRRRLTTVRLLDCQGARKVLEEVTGALVQHNNNHNNNQGLERLYLQYSSMETCSMTIHALNALYLATVIHNQQSSLKELQVVAASPRHEGEQPYRLHQLAAFLGHPLCSLQSLRLHLGTSPYHLDVLGDRLRDNHSLRHLSLSGDEPLDVSTTLQDFVAMLHCVPKLTSLQLDFPQVDHRDQEVLRIFDENTTLEEIRVEEDGEDGHPTATTRSTSRNPLAYMGLRNRIRKKLLQHGRGPELWKEILSILLTWRANREQQNQHDDFKRRLSPRNRDLVFTSGLWFALTECPVLVEDIARAMQEMPSSLPALS